MSDKPEPVVVTTDDGTEYITFASNTTIRMPKQIDWLPQPDITPYELALCIPSLFALAGARGYYPEDGIAALPEGARRHFRIRD